MAKKTYDTECAIFRADKLRRKITANGLIQWLFQLTQDYLKKLGIMYLELSAD
jgi:hypothetical protein